MQGKSTYAAQQEVKEYVLNPFILSGYVRHSGTRGRLYFSSLNSLDNPKFLAKTFTCKNPRGFYQLITTIIQQSKMPTNNHQERPPAISHARQVSRNEELPTRLSQQMEMVIAAAQTSRRLWSSLSAVSDPPREPSGVFSTHSPRDAGTNVLHPRPDTVPRDLPSNELFDIGPTHPLARSVAYNLRETNTTESDSSEGLMPPPSP